MKKMLVSDYDGTFYKDKNDLLGNIQAAKEFRIKGNLFVIATGRSYVSFLKEYNNMPFSFSYLILCNGALILDSDFKYVRHYKIEHETLVKIQKTVSLFNEYIEQLLYVSKFQNTVLNPEDNEVVKVKLYVKKENRAYDISKSIKKNISNVNSYVIPLKNNEFLVEIITNKTNKAKAIEDIMLVEKITEDNVYTIGDSQNDLEMVIRFNGYKVSGAHKDLSMHIKKEIDSVEALIDKIMG